MIEGRKLQAKKPNLAEINVDSDPGAKKNLFESFESSQKIASIPIPFPAASFISSFSPSPPSSLTRSPLVEVGHKKAIDREIGRSTAGFLVIELGSRSAKRLLPSFPLHVCFFPLLFFLFLLLPSSPFLSFFFPSFGASSQYLGWSPRWAHLGLVLTWNEASVIAACPATWQEAAPETEWPLDPPRLPPPQAWKKSCCDSSVIGVLHFQFGRVRAICGLDNEM